MNFGPRRSTPTLEELEPRILYSADTAALAQALDPGVVDSAPLTLSAPAQSSESALATSTRPSTEQAGQRREIVFVDGGVENAQAIAEQLRASEGGSRFLQVVVLEQDRDGVAQITEALTAIKDLTAIHIVSHGQNAAVLLGNMQLNASSLLDQASALSQWGASLAADADLLLYGCDVAQTEAGQAFASGLALLTGADVAASIDATGQALLGGDWDLEYRTGDVAFAAAPEPAQQAEWQGLLGITAAGSETIANSLTAGNQYTALHTHAVAMDANGNFVLVWEDQSGLDGNSYGVYARRFDATGTALGAQFLVNTTTANTQASPAIAMNASGDFVVTWQSTNQDGSGTGVYAQRYNSAGVAQGGEFRVNSTTANNQLRAAPGMDSAGNFVVAWASQNQDNASSLGIYAQRFDASGVAQGGEFRVNTTIANDQRSPSVAMAPDGRFVVTWNGYTGTSYEIYAQRYDASGVAQGAETLVNTTTAGDQIIAVASMDNDANYVVIWEGPDSNGDGIYGQRYNSAGVAQGSEFQISTGNFPQGTPSVTMRPGGGFFVTWESTGQDSGSTLGIYVRQYDASGNAITAETLVNTTVAGSQVNASSAVNNTGSLVVAYGGQSAVSTADAMFQRYTYTDVNVTASGLVTTEAGATATFTVVLASAPTANVTVGFSLADGTEGSLSASSLLFTTANWSTPQVITVTGVNDTYIDGDIPYTLTIAAATSTDGKYSGINPADRTLTNTDDDTVNTMIVTTVSDTSDGDTSSVGALINSMGADNRISLREAITAANNTANGVGGADRINFNVPDALVSGMHTIAIASALPSITQALAIDGSTEPDYAGQPVIFINGVSTVNTHGITLAAGSGGSTIRGLSIGNLSGTGIGISVGSSGNTIAGNYVGINLAGAAPNANYGIRIANVDANVIGGTTAADRNVLSNNLHGIYINNGDSNVIQGNYIGTNATGTSAQANTGDGISINNGALSNQIGGSAPGAGNVVSGNADDGIKISGSATSGTVIQGNRIGVAADGATALGNGTVGVHLTGGASTTTIGGIGAGNVFGGGTYLIHIDGVSTGVVIRGNYLGTDVTGSANMGSKRSGVYIQGGAFGNSIGGTADGEGNVIAFNGTDNIAGNNYGVHLNSDAGVGNAILRNSIYSNVGLGINLGTAGADANDAGDADSGPNGLQNYPVLSSALASGSQIRIVGSLNSLAATNFRIEFFASSSADASGYGEGQRYLGFADVVSNGSGAASFDTTLNAAVIAGEYITATATDLSTNNTSEFSVAILTNTAPVITSNGGGGNASTSVDENTTAVTTVVASDSDLPPQSLAYSITGGADALLFAIHAGTGVLTFTAPRNYETPEDADGNNQYIVTVQVSDGNGGIDTQAITVTVTDVNEAPVITSNGGGANASVSIAENTTAVTTVAATDVDSPAQTLSYTIVGGADAALFTVDAGSGALSFSAPADYDAPADADADNVYAVIVQASDGNGGTDTQTIGVTVTPLNDNAPVISSNGGGANASVSIAENTTAVTTVVAADGDTPAQTLTYSIVGGGDAALFAIDSSTGTLSFVAPKNFEAPVDADGDNVYVVAVQVSDGSGGTDAQTISVTVTDTNEAPVITSNGGGASGSTSASENTTAVTTVTSTDVDGPAQTLTYSISGGDDAALFAIDSSTGALSFIAPKNFEAPVDADSDNVYVVAVQVSDGNGGTDTQTISVTVTDSNESPVITSNGGGSSGSVSVSENTTAVATVAATDPDTPAQTMTYSISGGADAALFAVDSSTGVLSLLAPKNFEAPADADGDNVYVVAVQVSDGNGGTDTQTISVTVTDSNEAPVVTSNGGGASGSTSISENTTAVTTVTATDVDGPAQTLTYSISGGDDAALFAIDSSTGALSFIAPKNFEAPVDADSDNVYVVDVQVSDGSGGTDTQTLSVTVTDSNESPVITSNGGGSSGSVSVSENTTAVATVTATDVDGPAQTLTYSISGGDDAALFSIDSSTGALSFLAPKNFEAPADADGDNVYVVAVQVSDGNGGADTQTISVTVTDSNEAPVITSNGGGSSGSVSVSENTTAVATVAATDPDTPAQTMTYSISGGADAALFAIDSGTGALSFLAPKNFEAPADADGDNVYVVAVQVSDGNGGTDAQTISVTVTDTNEAPVITSNGGGSSGSTSISENTTAVTTVTATDVDGPAQTLTYSISGGDDAALFAIDSSTGALSFLAPKNFEAPADADGDSVYVVAVQVSDGSGGTDTQTLSVTVTDTNESPVITSNGGGANGSTSVTESTTAVTTVTATDVDGPAQTLTYSISGGDDAALFAIDSSTGALSFLASKNFEAPADADSDNVYVVAVQVSDGSGGTDTQTLSVTVTDSNEAPVITSNGGGASGSVSVAENTTAVATVTATDPDAPAQTLTYSISGGADAALFAIDSSTGALSFLAPKNFEAPVDADGDNVYVVDVQVSDGNGGTDAQTISVTVTDTNEAPVITSNGGGSSGSTSVSENTTAVTTVTATDVDGPAQTLTYSISGGDDAALFSIDSSTGALSFLTPKNFEAPVDADGDNVYVVDVQVSDGSGGTDTQTLSVTVTDANEAPVITSNGGGASGSVSVSENTTAVATVAATDPDTPAQTMTYSISGGADAALFAVDSSTGALSFLAPKNFEAPADADGDNVYVVDVEVSDGSGGTDTQTISVTVTDSNEAPVVTSNGGGASGSTSISENTTAVTTVTATDVDGPAQALTYSISGGDDAALFAIDSSSGALSFLAPKNFEAPADADGDNVYVVDVQVSDGNGGTDTQTLSVTVTGSNELPVITSNGGGASGSASVTENTTAVATVTATDVDGPAQTLTYSISGGDDAALFAVDSGTGILSFAAPKNFEAPIDADGDNVYIVDVQVSDGNGGTDTQTISVTVTDVNEAPIITSNGSGASGSASVAENTTAVTTVTAADPDAPAQTMTYAISGGADAALFSIDSSTGALSFITPKNSQAPVDADGDNVYVVAVQASDGAGGTDVQTLSVTVTDTNGSPVITSNGGGSAGSLSVAENTTAVTTVTATDADLPAQPLTYTIAGGADAALFTIDASTGVLSFLTPKDVDSPSDSNGDNVYVVTVEVSDANGGSDSQTLSVTVTGANHAPVITSNGGGSSATAVVAEGNTAVTTVTATDVDTPVQPLSYSIIGGTDAALFMLDSSTGILTFRNAPDYEQPGDADGDNTYALTVQVADGQGGMATQHITVIAAPVNDNAPRFQNHGGAATVQLTAPENANNTIALAATDADRPSVALRYSIAGGADAALFGIDTQTGALKWLRAPDFEAAADADGDGIYEVRAQVSDGTLTATQTFFIRVEDVSEPPSQPPVEPPAPPPADPPAPSNPPAPSDPVIPPASPTAGGPFDEAADPVPVLPVTDPVTTDPLLSAPAIIVRDTAAHAVVDPRAASAARGDTSFFGALVSAGSSIPHAVEPTGTPAAADPAAPASAADSTLAGFAFTLQGPDRALPFSRPGAAFDTDKLLAGWFDATPSSADERADLLAIALNNAQRVAAPTQAPIALAALSLGPASEESAEGFEPQRYPWKIAGAALSLGSLYLATRRIALLYSVLASMPAWRNFDPLPFLERGPESMPAGGPLQDDDEELVDHVFDNWVDLQEGAEERRV
jgi:hypothetical protein